VRDALATFASLTQPGGMVRLPYEWADDDAWKDGVMRPSASGAHDDTRVERHAQPQYQSDADRDLAERALARGGCATCVWLDDTATGR